MIGSPSGPPSSISQRSTPPRGIHWSLAGKYRIWGLPGGISTTTSSNEAASSSCALRVSLKRSRISWSLICWTSGPMVRWVVAMFGSRYSMTASSGPRVIRTSSSLAMRGFFIRMAIVSARSDTVSPGGFPTREVYGR
jgi:hypothetical protein